MCGKLHYGYHAIRAANDSGNGSLDLPAWNESSARIWGFPENRAQPIPTGPVVDYLVAVRSSISSESSSSSTFMYCQ